jgi:hypothetical protein
MSLMRLAMQFMASLSAFHKAARHNGQHRHSPRQQVRDGVCKAALRAFVGAELYRGDQWKLSLKETALCVGSNIHYLRAALVLLDHGDLDLIDRVLHRERDILLAARSVAPLVKLLTAFRTASPGTQAIFSGVTGLVDLSSPAARTAAASKFDPEVIWTDMVEPRISA